MSEHFEDVMGDAILSLPQDLKAVLRIVEDPDLEEEQRILAGGALLHLLSGQNAIPGMRGIIGFVDDVIVIRLVLERLEKAAPEVMAQHRKDSPELFDPLESQMASVREYLGELIAVLDKACDQLPKLTHQGYSAVACARDEEASTWLYDAVHEALVDELDFDEDEVGRELRGISKIRRPLEMRMSS